jgi:hypothetical protein
MYDEFTTNGIFKNIDLAFILYFNNIMNNTISVLYIHVKYVYVENICRED